MRPPRRQSTYRRTQGGQRTARPFIHIEAPVGGWNTRDSEDNVPPTDALVLDNWWPDLGEVRTRPGYSIHCDITDVVSGLDQVVNGSFEIAGGGTPDVFGTWVEATSRATIYDETTNVHSGSHACKMVMDLTASPSASVTQTIATLTEETVYRLSFYDVTVGTSPLVTPIAIPSIKYSIYDNDNSDYIVEETKTEHFDTSADPINATYVKTSVFFETPPGCTSVDIVFTGEDGFDTYTYLLDSVTLYEAVLVGGAVETLAEYISGSNRDLIAVCGGEAFDVTTSTPSHLSGLLSSFDNSRFQWANFDGKLGLVNGKEKLQWNGTALTALNVFEDDGSTPLTPIGINVFKSRTWFWEAGSQNVWYSELNTLGGTCTEFPLSRVGQFGGNLILMMTWTRDGGSGPDDFAVFVMSSGEAIVYQGSYPGAAGDWALVGIYNIGEPLGYRSAVKFGGDLYIMTKLDVVRMSEVLTGVEARQMETKVSKAHRIAVGLAEDNWGWEASIHPKNHMAIFNIPITENEETQQHVQNTITGAWCRFKDIVANTWQTYDGDMYFGSEDGKIYKFGSDEDDDGTAIQSTFQTAWLPLGGLGGNKIFKQVREAYRVNTGINVSNYFTVDFRDYNSQAFPDAVSSSGAVWDATYWDQVPWSSSDYIYYEWEGIGEYGERLGMRKRLSTKQQVTYLGAAFLIETGERL